MMKISAFIAICVFILGIGSISEHATHSNISSEPEEWEDAEYVEDDKRVR